MNKLKIDKKGILSFEVMLFIPRLIFMSLMVLIIIIMVESFVQDSIDTSQAEIEIMSQRLLYSPNAIIYCNERCYPGIIDMKYLEQDVFQPRMEKAFNSSRPRVAFRIKLIEGQNTLKNRVFNDAQYQEWFDLSKIAAYQHQYTKEEKEMFVLYRENGVNKPAKLQMTMVMEVG